MIGQITDESLYGVLSDQSCVISITARHLVLSVSQLIIWCYQYHSSSSCVISITARHLVLSIIVWCLHQMHRCVIYIIQSEGCFWIMAKFGWQIVLLTGRGEVSWLNLIGC